MANRMMLAAVALAMLGLPAAAEAARKARHPAAQTQVAPPTRLGFGADNDAQPGGVPGNAPFNNQLRKFTDPLGANGGR